MVAKRRENVGSRDWKILQNVGEENGCEERENVHKK